MLAQQGQAGGCIAVQRGRIRTCAVLCAALIAGRTTLQCQGAHQAAEQRLEVLNSHGPQLQYTTSLVWQQCQPGSMLILRSAIYAPHLLCKLQSDQAHMAGAALEHIQDSMRMVT